MPSKEDVTALMKRISDNEENGYQSFTYPRNGGMGIRLPLWVASYWNMAYFVTENKDLWQLTIQWLKGQNQPVVLEALHRLPWAYKSELSREIGNGTILDLTQLCSERWLSCGTLDLIMAVLQAEVKAAGLQAAVMVNHAVQKLIKTYRFEQDIYATSKPCWFLREIGKQLYNGEISALCVAFGVNVSGAESTLADDLVECNHWVALIVDTHSHSIRYGDPMKLAPPAELLNVMLWWLRIIFPDIHFMVENLACGKQHDGISCGLFTMNALMHYFFPVIPFLETGKSCCIARLEWFKKILNLLLKEVCIKQIIAPKISTLITIIAQSSYSVSSLDEPSNTSCFSAVHSFPPIQAASTSNARPPSVSKGKIPGSESVAKGKEKGSNPSQPPNLLGNFISKGQKRSVAIDPGHIDISKGKTKQHVMKIAIDPELTKDDPKCGTDNARNEEMDVDDTEAGHAHVDSIDDDDMGMAMDLTKLVDIVEGSRKTGKGSTGGRPKKKLLDTFLQKCYHVDKPEKHIYRCVGSCGTTYSIRAMARTIKHARNCQGLSAEQRRLAKAHAAAQAPSQKLRRSPDVDKSRQSEGQVVAVKRQKTTDDRNVDSGPSRVEALVNKARILGRKERHNLLDLAIVKFFCITGIPTSIAAKNIWKEMLIIADPSYHPASRSKLEDTQIISEAENVLAKQREILRREEDLTISCDGGTSEGHEAFWTAHVSTPARKVYFMDLCEATKVSHTGEWVKEFVLAVSHRSSMQPFLFVSDLD